MDEKKALAMFGQGFDCSQVVFGEFAPELGMDEETALKTASAFGGGMWRGQTCGCVTGALMAIGLKFGHSLPGDEDQKNIMLAKKAQFEAAFQEKWESLSCRGLLGYDLSVPREMKKIMASGLLTTKCPVLVASACEILEDIL